MLDPATETWSVHFPARTSQSQLGAPRSSAQEQAERHSPYPCCAVKSTHLCWFSEGLNKMSLIKAFIFSVSFLPVGWGVDRATAEFPQHPWPWRTVSDELCRLLTALCLPSRELFSSDCSCRLETPSWHQAGSTTRSIEKGVYTCKKCSIFILHTLDAPGRLEKGLHSSFGSMPACGQSGWQGYLSHSL